MAGAVHGVTTEANAHAPPALQVYAGRINSEDSPSSVHFITQRGPATQITSTGVVSHSFHIIWAPSKGLTDSTVGLPTAEEI